MLQRAADAQYEGIMITVDTAVLGRRERDVRRGFSLPPKIGLDTVIDGVRHPRWTWDFLKSDPIQFANVKGNSSVGDGSTPVTLPTTSTVNSTPPCLGVTLNGFEITGQE